MLPRATYLKTLLPLLLVRALSTAEECDCDGFYCVRDGVYQLCADGRFVGAPVPCFTGETCGNATTRTCRPQLMCRDGAECLSQGSFPVADSDRRFYSCARDPLTGQWIKTEGECPEGMHFRGEKGRCEEEEEGFACETRGYFPDPEDCRRFYVCDETNVPFRMNCDDGTYFDEIASACVWLAPQRCRIDGDAADVATEGVTAGDESSTQDGPGRTRWTDGSEENDVADEGDGSWSAGPGNGSGASPSPEPDSQTDPPRSGATAEDDVGTDEGGESRSTGSASTTEGDGPRTTPSTERSSEITPTVSPATEDDNSGTDEGVTGGEQGPNASPNDPGITPSSERSSETTPTVSAATEDDNLHQGATGSEQSPNASPNDPGITPAKEHSSETTPTVSPATEDDNLGEGVTGGEQGPNASPSYPGITPSSERSSETTPTVSAATGDDDLGTDEGITGSGQGPNASPSYPGITPSSERSSETTPTVSAATEDDNLHQGATSGEESPNASPNDSGITPAKEHSSETTPTVSAATGDDNLHQGATGSEQGPNASPNDPGITPAKEHSSETTPTVSAATGDDDLGTDEGVTGGGQGPNASPNDPGMTPATERSSEITPTVSAATGDDNSGTDQGVTAGDESWNTSPGGATGATAEKNPGTGSTTTDEGLASGSPDPAPTPDPEESTTGNAPDADSLVSTLRPAQDVVSTADPGAATARDPAGHETGEASSIKDYAEHATTAGSWSPASEAATPSTAVAGSPLPDGKSTPSPTDEEGTFSCPGEGYFPHPDNCSIFFICFNWNSGNASAVRIECPAGRYYDQETYLCVTELPKRCRAAAAQSTTTTPAQGGEFECPGTGYFPDPKDCRRYYVCYDLFYPQSVTCPTGYYYDEDARLCVTDAPERCGLAESTPGESESGGLAPTGLPFVCPGEGYYADPENCTRYYVCYDWSSPILTSCPADTYFGDAGFCTFQMPERCATASATTVPARTTAKPDYEDYADFACPGEGYFADPEDCRRYYICHGSGGAVAVLCPDGHYFDDVSALCTPRAPERCRASEAARNFSCKTAGTFPDPKSCRTYWICLDDNFGFSVSCPDNTYFNRETTFCEGTPPKDCADADADEPNNVGESSPDFRCPKSAGGYFPDPNDCQKYHACFPSGFSFSLRCTADHYYHEDLQMCAPGRPRQCKNRGFACPSPGYHGDGVDCRKYYICDHVGAAIERTCPDGKYFDPRRYECASDADSCLMDNPQDHMVVDESFACPGFGYFPDPKNCDKYYFCRLWGRAYSLTCRKGTYFDEKLRECSPVLPSTRPCHQSGNGSETDEERDVVTESPSEFACPDHGVFPDPDDCRKFYICYGPPRHVTCRSGMYFDEESSLCAEEMPRRCRASTAAPAATTGSLPKPEFRCTEPGRFPDPDDCRKFYRCDGRLRASRESCPAATYFHPERRRCRGDAPESCRRSLETSEDAPGECPGRGNFPDLLDPRKYFYCRGSGLEAIHYACPKNKYFNKNKRKCKKAAAAAAGRPADGAEDSSESDSDEDGEEEEEDGEHVPFTCTQSGYFADPEDCQKYYRCSPSLQVFHRTCPPGTYFNAFLRFCSVFASGKCRRV